MADVTRRHVLTVSAIGAAGLVTAAVAGKVQASTQKPVVPERGGANPTGKFANKVVLITGATSGVGEATAGAFANQSLSGCSATHLIKRSVTSPSSRPAVRSVIFRGNILALR